MQSPQPLPRELVELEAGIDALPEVHRAELRPNLDRLIDRLRRRRQILSLVQDSLSQLRLDMKYLMFDLEATRRERDSLRSQQQGDGTPPA